MKICVKRHYRCILSDRERGNVSVFRSRHFDFTHMQAVKAVIPQERGHVARNSLIQNEPQA